MWTGVDIGLKSAVGITSTKDELEEFIERANLETTIQKLKDDFQQEGKPEDNQWSEFIKKVDDS